MHVYTEVAKDQEEHNVNMFTSLDHLESIWCILLYIYKKSFHTNIYLLYRVYFYYTYSIKLSFT